MASSAQSPMKSGNVTNVVTLTDPICPEGTAFAAAVDDIRAGRHTAGSAAASLVAQLDDDELLWILDGDQGQAEGLRAMSERYNGEPIVAGRIDRLGIPGIRFADGPRGVVPGTCTAFPVSVARAASWDVELERRVGAAIGAEARAVGANLFAGVCMNVPPFPGWGRSQEAYGENPLLTGEMAAALISGARPWVLACVKHLALNSMEEARFTVDARATDDVLQEAYLPHFRRAVEGGADAVMSAYNRVNGEWAGQNRALLNDILRDQWDFDGFVMSDFVWGLRDPIGSVSAGLDLEMPVRQQRARALPAALADGRLPRQMVERAAQRLIAAQLRLALRASPTPPATVIASPTHRSLAREAAARGMVLLKNAPVLGTPLLPIDPTGAGSIAVMGRLATTPNLGDNGSSRVWPPATVTPLEGLQERFGERVTHVSDLETGVDVTAEADVVVVVVGMGAHDEGEAMAATDPDAFAVFGGIFRWRWMQHLAAWGMKRQVRSAREGGDRRDLHLPPDDVTLIQRARALNPRVLVVMVGGGTIMPDPWDCDVPAILLAWYAGMEGGRALADVLSGDAEPAGRLPLTIPQRRSDLPDVDWNARVVNYPRWFGQAALDRQGTDAAYPMGFGLGYTDFAIRDLRPLEQDGEQLLFEVEVENCGPRPGRHVVQLYAAQTDDEHLPRRALIGFTSVSLLPRERRSVRVNASTRPLQRWVGSQWTLTLRRWAVEAAAYAGDPRAARAELHLT